MMVQETVTIGIGRATLNDAQVSINEVGSQWLSEWKSAAESNKNRQFPIGLGEVAPVLSKHGIVKQVAALTLDALLEKADDTGKFRINSFGNPYLITIRNVLYKISVDGEEMMTFRQYEKLGRLPSIGVSKLYSA